MISNFVNYDFSYVAGTDVPVPTHYFVVLTSCKNKTHTPDSCPGWLDVLPFVVPHRPTNVESCPVSTLGEPRPEDYLYYYIYIIYASAELSQKPLYLKHVSVLCG